MRALLLASLLALGCGSDDDNKPGGAATQSDIDSACATRCAAQKKCISTVDETTCINQCKNDAAVIGTKLRADVVSATNSCFSTASCDKLADCGKTATASISPSAAAQSFCDAYTKKVSECRTIGLSSDKSKCLDDWKAYSDATLDAASACLSKACNDYVACALTSFGVR